jgi:hypothetical protein
LQKNWTLHVLKIVMLAIIETDQITVNLVIIKACFRFLTFDKVRDKLRDTGCRGLDAGYWILDEWFIKLIGWIELIELMVNRSQVIEKVEKK